MRNLSTLLSIMMLPMIIVLSQCADNNSSAVHKDSDSVAVSNSFGGYQSREQWGAHLLSIGGCNDCHTPKKMTPMGPVNDTSLLLSGHPAAMPVADIDRKMLENKGIMATNSLTAWIGPWGVSFAANLTSDSTGIGNWTEDQFIYCLREGKWKGLEGGRTLLPPMPWENLKQMSDDELKALFAYLKSTPPIKNVVPAPLPPATAH